MLIGYSDGNIDLLQNDRIIFNIPGFKNKLLQGDKRILSASFHENEALISTYFGLLVVDMDNYEINDSYSSIGPNGTAIPVLSSAVVGDSIYIGTERGLRFAKWSNSVNLNDYTQWQWAIENNIDVIEGGAQGEHKMARGFVPVQTQSAHWLAHPGFFEAVENYLAQEREGNAAYTASLNSPFRDDPHD